MVRRAFTMIELIFAIVVIAISIVSLPMMVQSTSKGIEANIVQEAIFAAEAIITESTSYYWDGSSIEDLGLSAYSRVVNTGDCSATVPSSRIGHVNRSCLDDNTTTTLNAYHPSALEVSSTLYNDAPLLDGTASSATYKNSYNVTSVVTNCKDGACTQFGQENNNPNIKEIEIRVTNSTTGDQLVVFKAYSANIGEVRIENRDF